MPHWVVILVLVIVAWLLLSVVGGLALGRLLGMASRGLTHVGRPRLRVLHGGAADEPDRPAAAAPERRSA